MHTQSHRGANDIGGAATTSRRAATISRRAARLRRASSGISANIAEGSKRQSKTDFAHFLNVAEGSLAETEYLVILARDLGYVSEQTATPLLSDIDEIAPMLYTLRMKVAQGDR